MSAERARYADAVRALVEHALTTTIADDDLAGASSKLEAVAEHLRTLPPAGPKSTTFPDLSDPSSAFRIDPIMGRLNPIAPPVELEIVDGEVRGRARYGRQYEGPPGYVHGGIVAATFDMLLGVANIAGGNAGMTGTLTVRFRHPTPLDTDVHMRAAAVSQEGRKSVVHGEIHAGDTLCAEADGIFVLPAPARAAMLFPNA